MRIAPLDDAFPVFRSYDLDLQFRVMRLVAERSAVPVPAMVWLELDASKVGSPFLVMERLDGLVPPDNLPYPFGDNWLYDADPEDQRRLQDSTIAAMAGIHGIELTDDDRALPRHRRAGRHRAAPPRRGPEGVPPVGHRR